MNGSQAGNELRPFIEETAKRIAGHKAPHGVRNDRQHSQAWPCSNEEQHLCCQPLAALRDAIKCLQRTVIE